MADSPMRIKQLCIYPIKSLRGYTVTTLSATATGFEYDRRFMLQRVSNEKHISVAKEPEMCLFMTALHPPEAPEKVVVTYTKDHVHNKPDEKVSTEPLEIPLMPDTEGGRLKEREVNMHSSPTTGYEMGEKYDEWFSMRFGYNVRLIYVGQNRRKVLGSVSPNAAPVNQNGRAQSQGWFSSMQSSLSSFVPGLSGSGEDKENDTQYHGVDTGIGFADVAPFLIVSAKSYENAAKRVGNEELDVFKFRPNIVVEGADEDFEEDYWAELSITHADQDDVRIVLTSNCARCASLNVDYETGKTGVGEAGKILKHLQKDRRVDPGMKYSPIFGRYGFLARKGKAVDDNTEVTISVGDSVSVVRRNSERTRFQWPGISTDN